MVSGVLETEYLTGAGISEFTLLLDPGVDGCMIRRSYTNTSFYVLLVGGKVRIMLVAYLRQERLKSNCPSLTG